MPQSIRDQIQDAIRRANSESERAMLLLMLQMFDLWDEATQSIGAISAGMEALTRAHQGIPPQMHIEHHGFVERRKRVSDMAENEAAQVRVAVKRDLISKAIWSALSAVVTAAGIKLFGI